MPVSVCGMEMFISSEFLLIFPCLIRRNEPYEEDADFYRFFLQPFWKIDFMSPLFSRFLHLFLMLLFVLRYLCSFVLVSFLFLFIGPLYCLLSQFFFPQFCFSFLCLSLSLSPLRTRCLTFSACVFLTLQMDMKHLLF